MRRQRAAASRRRAVRVVSRRTMGFLESVHLYRKVPADLTDATRFGGVMSLLCAGVMAYLFVSNIQEYMAVQTSTDVALDDSGDIDMRIYFNLTMVRAAPARASPPGASSRAPRRRCRSGCHASLRAWTCPT